VIIHVHKHEPCSDAARSISQYEAQLRLWGLRKNLKRKEWEEHFERSGTRESGAATDVIPITVAGIEKAPSSVKRARRRMQQAHTSAMSASPAGSGSPLVTSVDLNAYDLEPDPVSRTEADPAWMISAYAPSSPPGFGLADTSLLALLDGLDDQSAVNIDFPVDNGIISQLSLPLCLAAEESASSFGSGIQVADWTNRSNMPLYFGSPNQWYERLPFFAFQSVFREKEVTISHRGIRQSYGSNRPQSFAMNFVTAVMSFRQDYTIPWPLSLQNGLRDLGAVLPRDKGTVGPEGHARDNDLVGVLLYSLLNGSVGLEDIPKEVLLRSLRHLGPIKSLFLDILRHIPRHTSKAFAENVFKAAIFADDEPVLALILESRLVDVNNTICKDFDGHRLTPVELAATRQAYGLVRKLFEQGADVNKSYAGPSARDHGALERLLMGACEGSDGELNVARTASPTLTSLVDFLVGRGAKANFRCLDYVVRIFTTYEIAQVVARSIPQSKHRSFFSSCSSSRFDAGNCVLLMVAKNVDDETATDIVRHMINICEQSGCRTCLCKDSRTVERATFEAAKRGHIRLVRLLVGHIRSLRLAFCGAIKSDDEEVIQLFLDRGAELNPPAIHLNGMHDDHILTTPLAEAKRTNNTALVRKLESAGALHSLLEGDRLEALMAAAAESGDWACVESLLARFVTSKARYRPSALVLKFAIESADIGIVHMLLDAGAEVNLRILSEGAARTTQTPLLAALHKRDTALVSAILDSDWIYPPVTGVQVGLALEAVRWGENSVLVDLMSMVPCQSQHDSIQENVYLAVIQYGKTENSSLRQILSGSFCNLATAQLNRILALAIQNDDSDMAILLLEHGADPFSYDALSAVVSGHQDMLKLLFDKASQRRTTPKCVGTSILAPLMVGGSENIIALDAILATGAVKLDVFDSVSIGTQRTWYFTPLGLAITGSSIPFSPNYEAAERLLQAGSDPNGIARLDYFSISISETALMLAIMTGRDDLVQLMIDHGADVNKGARLSNKASPIQCAAKVGHLNMVQLLIKCGSDVNGKAALRSGGTALQFAAISGNCNIVAELLKHGARLDALPSKVNGRWPLEGAAEHGRLDMIQFLWNVATDYLINAPYEIHRCFQVMEIPGFQERQCLRAMNFARENGHGGCMDLVSKLSGISEQRLDTDEYGAPWLAY
jgi:ankyrin repeat protein